PVKILKILHLDCTDDDPEELTKGSIDSTGQKYRPCAHSAILYRLGDISLQVRIIFQSTEVGGIGIIYIGNGPPAGRVDRPALAVEDDDSVELGGPAYLG